MRRIAVFNSFPYHYELFGSIIEWCKNKKYSLTIFTEMRNNLGWIDFYREFFEFDNFLNYIEYSHYLHSYELIILTTDNDPKFDWEKYGNFERTVVINHLNYSRYNGKSMKQIDFRPYSYRDNDWCSNVFRIYDEPRKIENEKIKILISAIDDTIDIEKLRELSFNCELHFVARNVSIKFRSLQNSFFHLNIDTKKMILLMRECDYFYFINSSNSPKNYVKTSGFLGLAFSCGTPILMTPLTNSFYGLKSVCYPSDIGKDLQSQRLKVFEERDCIIQKFERIFDSFLFPELETYTTIPKTIHFIWLSQNGKDIDIPDKFKFNVKTFLEKNEGFKIELWNNSRVDKLINEKFPEYYDIFSGLDFVGSKSVFARFAIICENGGVYSDLDFYSRGSIGEIINGKKEVFYKEIPEFENKNKLFNGFFASERNTPFIRGWMDRMIKNFKECKSQKELEFASSPEMLWKYFCSVNNPPILSDSCEAIPYVNNHIISKTCKNSKVRAKVYTLRNEEKDSTSETAGIREIKEIKFTEIMKPLKKKGNTLFYFMFVIIILALLLLILVKIK